MSVSPAPRRQGFATPGVARPCPPVTGFSARPPADEDFHDLIAERYEQAATIVTSNLDFTEWDQAFPANRLLAAATGDRLRHNAYCLTARRRVLSLAETGANNQKA